MATEKKKKFKDGTTRDDDFGVYMMNKNPELKKRLDKIKADAKKAATAKKKK